MKNQNLLEALNIFIMPFVAKITIYIIGGYRKGYAKSNNIPKNLLMNEIK